MLDPTLPALILAPMEGVTDAPMRAVQGDLGVFTFAVSEFLRVSQDVLPKSVILRHVPELRNESRTPNGLPVQVQLLGGDAGRLAASAAVAVAVGATAIDLNFGCPARTVNRHDGGATLLKYPARIREIVSTVRAALPTTIPVSAKMRLGWDSIDAIDENAGMAAEGGATWITIHARTRSAGYAPPVYWSHIGRVRVRLGIPVVANGDIWTLDCFRRCRDATGCKHFMLGRGAMANPGLAYQVAQELGINSRESISGINVPFTWFTRLERLIEWRRNLIESDPDRTLPRLKQWLYLAAMHGNFVGFDVIKRAGSIEELLAKLRTFTCHNVEHSSH
jgi:tRNA-dihydrouridine synthase C